MNHFFQQAQVAEWEYRLLLTVLANSPDIVIVGPDEARSTKEYTSMMISHNLMRDVERKLAECIKSTEKDPYGCCAAHFLGIPIAEVTKEQRDWIKQRIYEASHGAE